MKNYTKIFTDPNIQFNPYLRCWLFEAGVVIVLFPTDYYSIRQSIAKAYLVDYEVVYTYPNIVLT